MPVTPWLLLVLLSVTTARVTRLLVADAFPPIAVVRTRILERLRPDGSPRYSPHSWQRYLAGCPWCMAVWVAGALTLGVWAFYQIPGPVLYWATSAWVGGFLGAYEAHDDEEN